MPFDGPGVCDMELYHDSGVTQTDDIHKHAEGNETADDGGLSKGLVQEAQGAYAATKAKMTSHAALLTAERTLSQLGSKQLEDLGLGGLANGVIGGSDGSASLINGEEEGEKEEEGKKEEVPSLNGAQR